MLRNFRLYSPLSTNTRASGILIIAKRQVVLPVTFFSGDKNSILYAAAMGRLLKAVSAISLATVRPRRPLR
jgi:hypothetical protein